MTIWLKETDMSDNGAYMKKVLLQVEDLNAVIEKIKSEDFVDKDNIYLLGSSMGGVTVATCAVIHTDDIKGTILQYPVIFLNEQAYEIGAEYPVLLLQGDSDKVVPDKYSIELCDYYNSIDKNHCRMIIYNGQPHVFTGKYKVIAAKDIYEFINS